MIFDLRWPLRGHFKVTKVKIAHSAVERRSAPGSSCPRTARVAGKIDEVDDLVLSQDNAPNIHRTQRQIAHQTDISLTSVHRIINSDLHLKCFKKRHAHELTEVNKIARRDRCRKLLKRYPDSVKNFCRFTDEKIFTITVPSNSQNDRL